jgi:hypothetical protein
MSQQETVHAPATDNVPKAALACGILGFMSTVVMYWLILPGLVLGLAAVLLGWRARRRGELQLTTIAITLGVVTMILVPAFVIVAEGAEDWGRDCALHPEQDSNC